MAFKSELIQTPNAITGQGWTLENSLTHVSY